MAEQEFGQLLRAVGRLLEDVDGHARRVVDDCRRWLRLLGPAGAALDRLAGQVEQAAGDAANLLESLLQRPGDPIALHKAAARWRVGVAAPAGARAATFTAEFARADDHWRGPAADAYLATLPPQHRALAETHEIAAAAADSLQESAAALLAFWAAAVPALTSVSAELAAAAAMTADPFTAPAGAALALAALAEGIAVVNGLTRALSEVLDRERRTQESQLARLADAAVFPGGRWPVAAAESLSDASLSDGDGTDWSLIR
ncbi:hypothetical protein [Dactylosporangium sp. CA-139066]|uniref:hypothetical protein n=1 Tax=Dactylosporangium sp. CA-139066 TaxID=3239930 RepID=UPI003D90683F